MKPEKLRTACYAPNQRYGELPIHSARCRVELGDQPPKLSGYTDRMSALRLRAKQTHENLFHLDSFCPCAPSTIFLYMMKIRLNASNSFNAFTETKPEPHACLPPRLFISATGPPGSATFPRPPPRHSATSPQLLRDIPQHSAGFRDIFKLQKTVIMNQNPPPFNHYCNVPLIAPLGVFHIPAVLSPAVSEPDQT